MGKTVINIENAVVSYREDVALRGVSISIEAGEFVGVIGPNGAGKTTLLTIVNGLGKLLSGRVWVLGDYHLQSTQGRLETRTRTWLLDEVDSPCIDAGYPKSIWQREPLPHGRRINMGIYGGTEQASKSVPEP